MSWCKVKFQVVRTSTSTTAINKRIVQVCRVCSSYLDVLSTTICTYVVNAKVIVAVLFLIKFSRWFEMYRCSVNVWYCSEARFLITVTIGALHKVVAIFHSYPVAKTFAAGGKDEMYTLNYRECNEIEILGYNRQLPCMLYIWQMTHLTYFASGTAGRQSPTRPTSCCRWSIALISPGLHFILLKRTVLLSWQAHSAEVTDAWLMSTATVNSNAVAIDSVQWWRESIFLLDVL